MTVSRAAELFMQYDYKEMKDLAFHFLSLVSGILVFSVTFADRFRTDQLTLRRRQLLLASWAFLVASIVFCGIALVVLAIAGGEAIYGHDYRRHATASYLWLITGGFSFVAGLIALVVVASASLFSGGVKPPAATTR